MESYFWFWGTCSLRLQPVSIPILLTVLLLLICSSPSAAEEPSLRRTPIVRAVEKAGPAVVNISGQKTTDFKYFTGHRDEPQVNGMGTGVIIHASGYILTNYHVIAGIERIHIKLNRLTPNQQRQHTAHLVGFDRSIDLAIIKINSEQSFPVIPLSTSADLLLGETVIAIGNAYGYEDTITRGIISSLHRRVQVNDEQFYDDLIQTDASINPGNSGGPLINIHGNAIGINVAVRVGAQSIGFAIPMDKAMDSAATILREKSEKRILLGAKIETSGHQDSQSLLVTHISNNSLATVAGLKSKDLIKSINGEPVRWAADLYHHLLQSAAGDDLNLSVKRDGELLQLRISLKNIAQQDELVSTRAWEEIGIQVTPVDFKSPTKTPVYNGGLKVTQVRPGSPARRQGLRNGDILLGIHKWETVNYDNLNYVLNSEIFMARSPIVFYIYREREFMYGEFFSK